MAQTSTVYDETYNKYLDDISTINFKLIEKKLGIKCEGAEAFIPLIGKTYKVSGNGIFDLFGKQPTLEICIVIFKYLLLCPEVEPDENEWAAFRDFRDSGPLTTYFLNDVERPIASFFSGKIEKLKNACKALKGYQPDIKLSYEIALSFTLLPKIPVLMLFNDSDEVFPAKCSILFEKSAEKYLDAESLAILGSLFTKNLKNHGTK